jgi:DNA-binding beta-propeller fold protein YncE
METFRAVALAGGLVLAAPFAVAQVAIESSFDAANFDHLALSIPRTGTRAFVTSTDDFADHRIDVVDLATNAIVQSTATTELRPPVLSPDGGFLAKTDTFGNAVIFYRTDDVRQQTGVRLQGHVPQPAPDSVAFAADGRTLYVLQYNPLGQGEVDAIDVASMTQTGWVAVPGSVFFTPLFAVSPSAPLAIVGTLQGDLDVVDLTSLQVARVVPLGGRPSRVTFLPDGRFAWIGSGIDTLSLVDLATGTVGPSLSVPGLAAPVAFDGDRGQLLVPVGSGLDVRDPSTLALRAHVPVAGVAFGAELPFLRDVGLVLVASRNPDAIHVLDVDPSSTTFATDVQTLPLPNCNGSCQPYGVVIHPDEARGYVLSSNRRRVDVLRLPTPPATIVLTPTAFAASPGGTLAFDARVRNAASAPQTVDAWIEILRTDGTPYPRPPVLGPRTIRLAVGGEIARTATLRVSQRAPRIGPLFVRGRVGTYGSSVVDSSSFPFVIR